MFSMHNSVFHNASPTSFQMLRDVWEFLCVCVHAYSCAMFLRFSWLSLPPESLHIKI